VRACHSDVSFDDMKGMLPSADEVRGGPDMIRDLNQGMISGALVKLRVAGENYIAADRTRMIDTSAFPSPTCRRSSAQRRSWQRCRLSRQPGRRSRAPHVDERR